MTQRRFSPGQRFDINGITFRVEQGHKVWPALDDLRLDWYDPNMRAWRAVKMEVCLFMVDFFTENEDALRPHRPWWKQNGHHYFLMKCTQTVRDGWESVGAEIQRQRDEW